MPSEDYVSPEQMLEKLFNGEVSLEEVQEYSKTLSYEDAIKIENALRILAFVSQQFMKVEGQ